MMKLRYADIFNRTSNAAVSIRRDGSGMQLLPYENTTTNVARQVAPSVATSILADREKKEKEQFLMFTRVLMK